MYMTSAVYVLCPRLAYFYEWLTGVLLTLRVENYALIDTKPCNECDMRSYV